MFYFLINNDMNSLNTAQSY